MITMLISRYTTDVELGTLSHVTFPGEADDVLEYLEPPWIQNQPFVSCVPPGVYAGVLDHSPRFSPRSGLLYFLVGGTVVRNEEDLLGKDAKRFACIAGHPANWHQQLQGCGAFGLNVQRDHQGNPHTPELGRSHFVGSSRNALTVVKGILAEGSDFDGNLPPVIQVIIGWDL